MAVRIPAVRRYVDMWMLSSLHPTNIELLQRLKSSDDRQFGKHMDVVGTVSDADRTSGDWLKTHLLGLRGDIWNPDARDLERTLQTLRQDRREQLRRQIRKSGRLTTAQTQRLNVQLQADPVMNLEADELDRRRLVLKLFKTTGTRLRWEGTLEEITTSEVHNTIGSRRSLLSFVAILPGHEYATGIQQNHRTFRIPALFTFCFFDEASERVWHVTIKRKWISIGADFTISVGRRRIGNIDGQLIGLGYNAYIDLAEHPLAANADFLDLITLFTASVGYHRAMRRSIRQRVRAVYAGRTQSHVIEDEEMWLLKNPRRRAA